MHTLSERLKLIASLIKRGASVCDVGTDHGYLPIFLKNMGIASSVIATDIREKPLATAEKNVKKADVSGIELRLCDGLDAVKKDEADTVIIAGMGGEVISGILSRCKWISNEDITLILQPMTSAEQLRKYLYDNGFEIIEEPTVLDTGRVYSVMLVRFSGKTEEKPSYFYYIGKIDTNTENGATYINKQIKRLSDCAASLENIPEKKREYEFYFKTAKSLEEIKNRI